MDPLLLEGIRDPSVEVNIEAIMRRRSNVSIISQINLRMTHSAGYKKHDRDFVIDKRYAAELTRKLAEMEKQRADEQVKLTEMEKQRADEQVKLTEIEKRRADALAKRSEKMMALLLQHGIAIPNGNSERSD